MVYLEGTEDSKIVTKSSLDREGYNSDISLCLFCVEEKTAAFYTYNLCKTIKFMESLSRYRLNLGIHKWINLLFALLILSPF
mmetsp:Transcript_16467/g.22583  ORF Transcript_16467/g.22583 Transcript_16467/m.22583 type:complete len:82 (+) Transcript_16467:1440-1685(+)